MSNKHCMFAAVHTLPPMEQCSQSDFTCEDGSCIPAQLVCDRKYDCQDGTDEFNCGQLRLTFSQIVTKRTRLIVYFNCVFCWWKSPVIIYVYCVVFIYQQRWVTAHKNKPKSRLTVRSVDARHSDATTKALTDSTNALHKICKFESDSWLAWTTV